MNNAFVRHLLDKTTIIFFIPHTEKKTLKNRHYYLCKVPFLYTTNDRDVGSRKFRKNSEYILKI